jgi:hypothetical protein
MDLEGTWEEDVIIKFEVLSRYFLAVTEENYKNLQSELSVALSRDSNQVPPEEGSEALEFKPAYSVCNHNYETGLL